jgi:hypothetical protein
MEQSLLTQKTKKIIRCRLFYARYNISEQNHAYDPTILKHLRNPHIPEQDESMIRYRVLKDGFKLVQSHRKENGSSIINQYDSYFRR